VLRLNLTLTSANKASFQAHLFAKHVVAKRMAEEISTGSKPASEYNMVHNANKQTNNNKSHFIGSKTQ